MWESGILTIDGTNIVWHAKVFDEGSVFGIKSGRISKLSARIGNAWILNYDRGWDIKSQGKTAEKVLELLLQKYKINFPKCNMKESMPLPQIMCNEKTARK